MKKRKKLQKYILKVRLLLSKITEDFWKITRTEGNTFVLVFLLLFSYIYFSMTLVNFFDLFF